jgi:uncharacterized membrane protein YgcG
MQYSLLDAPRSKKILADYEGVFSKRESEILITKLMQISSKYGIKIYFLTIKSLTGIKYSYQAYAGENRDRYCTRIYEIFGLEDTAMYNDANDVFIYVFSHSDRLNEWHASYKFIQKFSHEHFSEVTDPIIEKKFPKHQYFQAFKEIFQALDDELSRNKI